MRRHLHSINAENTIDRLKKAVKQEYSPPKFCKDCEWHEWEKVEGKHDYIYKHYCTCPPLLDMITGLKSNALKNRTNQDSCGKDAKYFSAKRS